jgi:hypothetical protein
MVNKYYSGENVVSWLLIMGRRVPACTWQFDSSWPVGFGFGWFSYHNAGVSALCSVQPSVVAPPYGVGDAWWCVHGAPQWWCSVDQLEALRSAGWLSLASDWCWCHVPTVLAIALFVSGHPCGLGGERHRGASVCRPGFPTEVEEMLV